MSSLLTPRSWTAHVQFVRWATKKAAGSTKNGRDSPGQRLGLKKTAGQAVFIGQIIARQRGTKWRSGAGTALGRDHSIYATIDGRLHFQYHPHLKKTWALVEPFIGEGGLSELTKAAVYRRGLENDKKKISEAKAEAQLKRKKLLADIEAFDFSKQSAS